MRLNSNRFNAAMGFQENSISLNNQMEKNSVEAYFERGRGQIGIDLVEMDTMNDTGIFEVTIQSKTSDKPFKTQIEAEFKDGKIFENSMETVNKDLSFFSEATNDIFHYSRGKVAELYPDYKKEVDEYDFTKMTAIAEKVNDSIERSLYQRIEINNDLEQKEKPKEKRKFPSLSMAM